MTDKITILLVIILIGCGYIIIKDEQRLNKLNDTLNDTNKNISIYYGHNWYPGNGYSLVLKSIDYRSDPKKIWLALYKNGSRIDDKILKEGENYSYNNEFNTTISHIYASKVILIKH